MTLAVTVLSHAALAVAQSAQPVAKPAPKSAAAPAVKPEPGASQTPSQPGVIDRVKAVPRKALLKRHRLEIAPMVGISLNDPFYVHVPVSGSLVFYPHDNFGLGLGADYMVAQPQTGNVAAVREGLTAVPATFDLPALFAHLDMYWLPLYGKASAYNSLIGNFDTYLSAGVGVASAFGSRLPLEANVAIGQHWDLEQWLALRIELRDHIFVDEQQVADPVVANTSVAQSSVQNYVIFSVGVSFFVPPTFEYSFQ